MKRKSLRRQLSLQSSLLPIRVAILGASTTQEVADLLELQLLASGFLPTLYQSDYGRFETEPLHDPAALIAFKPDVVYLHTSVYDLEAAPRLEALWSALSQSLSCTILQNTFELPARAPLGNLDLVHGSTAATLRANAALVEAAERHPRVLLNDVHSLSARVGLERWFDPVRYFSAKIVTTPEGSYALAQSLAALVRGLYGVSRKVLVLDLDNTLWGGVIGDDGPDRIQIGRETPLAEAYSAFQLYCLRLRQHGILLAVCSKNDEVTARSGFAHPDSILKLEHFAAFRANWNPKPDNLESIAQELSLGVESFVFVDDNPAERDIVRAQLPQVAVPELTTDVADYPRLIESHRYFEQVALSPEDRARAELYQQNAARQAVQARFADYGQYLASLEMRAEIAAFSPIYLDRIAQLTNKTNQFNLTTRRYTRAELEVLAAEASTVTLYGRLSDRFGDNGLVSVILCRRESDLLTIELWLMSCRVLKREMESAMLDELVSHARALGITALQGIFIPSRKNAMVAQHYASLGFTHVSTTPDGTATYILDLADYTPRNQHIKIAGA